MISRTSLVLSVIVVAVFTAGCNFFDGADCRRWGKNFNEEQWRAGFNEEAVCRQTTAINTANFTRDFNQMWTRDCDDLCGGGDECLGRIQYVKMEWDCVPNTDGETIGEWKGFYNIKPQCTCNEVD